jgi:electron transport complex protein RnfB
MIDLVAVIDEALCIGCTHCRTVCPFDAIVGGHQLMHTILTSECTGCELCLARCPVDCISMKSATKTDLHELKDKETRVKRARQRFKSWTIRLKREQLQRSKELLDQKERVLQTGAKVIQDILERSKK